MQLISIFTSLLFGFSVAHAGDFERTMSELQKRCPQIEECLDSSVQLVIVYNSNDGVSTNLSNDVLAHLETIAKKQAHVWADTILEGDYFADSKVSIDTVEEIKLEGRHVGYRISYSAKAWKTHVCNFDEDNLDSLRSCTEGRIEEKSFVSADLGSWLQDGANYAEFY